MIYDKFIKKNKQEGIATLPTVIVIGMMALAVVVSITAIALNELLISQGQAQSGRALFYAEGGVHDALLRISRNKNYSCTVADCYSVDYTTNGCTQGGGCAKISVSSDTGDIASPKIITSRGIMNSSIRIMQASVVLDGGTNIDSNKYGEISKVTWTELTN